jgi:hypothetical protein
MGCICSQPKHKFEEGYAGGALEGPGDVDDGVPIPARANGPAFDDAARNSKGTAGGGGVAFGMDDTIRLSKNNLGNKNWARESMLDQMGGLFKKK